MKVRCPICDAPMPAQPAEYPEFPFCSKRCRTIDLGRWLGESYRIPAEEAKEDSPSLSSSSDDNDS